MTFETLAPLELLLELPEPLELLELALPLELLLGLLAVLPLPPPPQPARMHRPSHRVHRNRWLMHQSRY
jgi:hypothetical protein